MLVLESSVNDIRSETFNNVQKLTVKWFFE